MAGDAVLAVTRRDDAVYCGWAPCAHTAEEIEQVGKWVDGLFSGEFLETAQRERPEWGGRLELLIWEINQLGVSITGLHSDQWVAVFAKGQLGKEEGETLIYADSFLLGVAKTYEWWRDKKAELKGAGTGSS